MKILVLGGAGYIGSVLTPHLLDKNDEVIVVDNLLYRPANKLDIRSHLIKGDVRDRSLLENLIPQVDAVVNLAALSNDPLSDLEPKLTLEINYDANKTIAKLCAKYGKRVVFASSCSVYGFSENHTFTEDSALGPVTLYAKTKMLSETFYTAPNVDAVVLRFATVYGMSPKPRFDLVVNTMTGTAYFNREITVNGGEQWRPLVHVKDVAHAIYLAIHSKNHTNRIFNIGSNHQNYQIKDLAVAIHGQMPHVKINSATNQVDKRSYKASFDRASNELGFKTSYDIKEAVQELLEVFDRKEITSLTDDVFYRIKYLKSHYNPDLQPRSRWNNLIFKLFKL